jgi:hypothetical protein
MDEIEPRQCREDRAHKAHYWGTATGDSPPHRCPGFAHPFFYLDWEKEVRRFHPPGPDQIQAARDFLAALALWEEMPDTAGSRWAVKFARWLADYRTPGPGDWQHRPPVPVA